VASGPPLRILEVAHGFPPFDMAGAEVFAHGLSRALVARGHDVRVFHRISDPSRPEYAVEHAQVDGLSVVRINNTFREAHRFEHIYRNDAIDAAFGQYLDRFRPSVVHFHHVTCLSTNLIAVARGRGIPVVYTLHDYWLICQRGQFLKTDLSICGGQDDGACVKCLAWPLNLSRRVARIAPRLTTTGLALPSRSATTLKRWTKAAYRFYVGAVPAARSTARAKVRARMDHVREMCVQIDAFIAPSQFLRRKFLDFGIPAARILHSPYGFDTSYYSVPRSPREGEVRFGYLGTWIPPKGVHVLIEAFNGIADERATLHIYGHAVPYEGYPDYGERLRALIQSPRIFLEGRYDNCRVGEILSGLDVLVVPSVWFENSPLTVQEAFLAGVPVVASNLGGMAELVQHESSGLLFRAGDAGDLRATLLRLLASPELRQRLRARPGSVKSLDESALEHERLFRALVAPCPHS
jgi:glycosyltransferase involved in cell wall biosynthesis